jgi:glycosyltransferase involved in cell wall biosynthesis
MAKRILIILPNLDLGGTEIVIMNYLRHIDREKIIFDFCVHGETGYFEDEAVTLGAKIFRAPTRSQGFFKNIFAMRKIYRDEKYDFAIVCSEHSFAFLELFVAWLSGVKTRAAWSMFSDYTGRSKVKRAAHFFARPLMRLFSNLRFACSANAGQWLFGKKFIIINNAIDLDVFKFNRENRNIREKIREKHELTDEFTIGIAGRLSAVKNHAFALEIIKECETDTVLLIVGDGELRAEIEKKAYEIDRKIIFTGRVDSIAEYYFAIDLLLIPSFHEGLSLVAIEAQASGIPVLLSDTITPEIKICELAHFISLDSGAKTWAEKIADLKKHERTAMDFKTSGYDIKEEAKKLQKILERDA